MLVKQKRTFRFGVVLTEACSRAELVKTCRQAEELGYDVISVPDHLGMPAPLATLLIAAEATVRPRISTYVLNTAFHNPAVLARELMTIDRLTDGRLELGLGAGYVAAEFEQAGLPFGSARARLAHLTAVLDGLAPQPPLLLGGHGDRMLRFAAEFADVVSFLGARSGVLPGRMTLVDAASLLRRVSFAREAAGHRADGLEFNVLSKSTVLTRDRRSAMERLRQYGPDLTVDDLLDVPTLFVGTVSGIAEQLRRHREVFGISYFTVLQPAMADFAKVLQYLR